MAATHSPPVISLDLAAMGDQVVLQQLPTSIYQASAVPYTDSAGKTVISRQDWTQRCPAGPNTNSGNCPEPIASAYDNNNEPVQVYKSIFLVNLEGTNQEVQVVSINYSERSAYLLKFDAYDSAGNPAEQIVFGLILDDTTGPVIDLCSTAIEHVEAASAWTLCKSSADDNIDGDVSASIRYTVQKESTSSYVCENQDWDEVTSCLTTLDTGTFVVVLSAHDGAGIYGHNAQNNTLYATKTVIISDNTDPYLTVEGQTPITHECSLPYTDSSAVCADSLDTVACAGKSCFHALATTTTGSAWNGASNTLTDTAIGTPTSAGNGYVLVYGCTDNAGNTATAVNRTVNVVDTTIPSIVLVGDSTFVHHAGDAFQDPGVTASDTCDKTNLPISMDWEGGVALNIQVPATYKRQYSTTDASGNTNSVIRTFHVEDHTAPLLEVTNGYNLTLEASATKKYVDAGATCSDYVDGELTTTTVIDTVDGGHVYALQVSDTYVDLRVPGTYTITYNCRDKAGNTASTLYRTIVVQDTTCPRITLTADEHADADGVVTIEAGFPYTDAGASATDDLDGDISSAITKDGDTVDTERSFYSRRSCKDIKDFYPAANTGNYYITTGTATTTFQRVQVWCDMSGAGNTYYACTGCARVVPYNTEQGGCSAKGMQMANFVSDAAKTHFMTLHADQPEESRFFPTGATTTTNYYLCSTNDHASTLMDSYAHMGATVNHNEIAHAEEGKYIISYHVADSAGNTEYRRADNSPCQTPAVITRTVLVRDTLPPVITLHLHDKIVHVSGHTKTGMNGVANPAGGASNPFIGANPVFKVSGVDTSAPGSTVPLMAETATKANNVGYAPVAAAFGVAGLVMLAQGRKRAEATVAVPV